MGAPSPSGGRRRRPLGASRQEGGGKASRDRGAVRKGGKGGKGEGAWPTTGGVAKREEGVVKQKGAWLSAGVFREAGRVTQFPLPPGREGVAVVLRGRRLLPPLRSGLRRAAPRRQVPGWGSGPPPALPSQATESGALWGWWCRQGGGRRCRALPRGGGR